MGSVKSDKASYFQLFPNSLQHSNVVCGLASVFIGRTLVREVGTAAEDESTPAVHELCIPVIV